MFEPQATGNKLFDLAMATKTMSQDEFLEQFTEPCLLQIPTEGMFPELGGAAPSDPATARLGNAGSTMHLSLEDLGSLKRSKNVKEALVHFVPSKGPGEASILGRADDCDLVLRAEGVSRKHAELRKQLGNYMLVDLDSHNGTFINGNQLAPNEPVKVTERQNVWLGAYRALFLFPEQVYNLASNLRKKM